MHIEQLKLNFFRNFSQADIRFSAFPTVLYGKNGSGKTNLLEAISLFNIGRGIKGDSIDNLITKIDNKSPNSQLTWALNMQLHNGVNLATGTHFFNNLSPRRIHKIQGKPKKSAQSFHDYIKIISITPYLDHLFINSSKDRRKFMDDLIFSYNPKHSLALKEYEKVLKQRLTILKNDTAPDNKWLSSLEKIAAERSVQISKNRLNFVEKLDNGNSMQISIFPKFTSSIIGNAENLAQFGKIDEIANVLKNNRNLDKAAGITTFGVHRSDWQVQHIANNCQAKDCSTGEQKIILIAVILSFIHQLKLEYKTLVVLLLDDITASLDSFHREVLFEQIENMNGNNFFLQTFLTGTDKQQFKELSNSNFLKVEDGKVYI